jgi:hypothetical protein
MRQFQVPGKLFTFKRRKTGQEITVLLPLNHGESNDDVFWFPPRGTNKIGCWKSRVIHNARCADRREKRIRKGLCRDCGKVLENTDSKRCRICLDKNQEGIEKRQKQNISKNLCPNHGIPVLSGYKTCERCSNNGRKKRYGLSVEDFENKRLEQNNRCGVCDVEFVGIGHAPLAPRIDHCHVSGKIRKLLCSNCNTGLGHFRDSIILLQKAIEYLKDFSK